MKKLLLMLILANQLNAEVTIEDSHMNLGSVYNIFVMNVKGTDPDTVYIFQISEDMVNWVDDDLENSFVGTGSDMRFYDLVLPESPTKFYRIRIIGSLL